MANASLTVNEFMAVNILTGVEKQPPKWGSYWLWGLFIFFFSVLLALILGESSWNHDVQQIRGRRISRNIYYYRLISVAILMMLQQKQMKKAPTRRRLVSIFFPKNKETNFTHFSIRTYFLKMIVARKRDKSDDPKMYVGDLPSSYAVQIIEKDANGHEVQKCFFYIKIKHSFLSFTSFSSFSHVLQYKKK